MSKKTENFTIFISWSKDTAKDLANALETFLKGVLCMFDINIFLSNAQILPGDNFTEIINKNLKKSNFGILILTNENKSQPWLMFEAGALAKNSDKAKIAPILFDRKEEDIESPLNAFTHINFNKEGFRDLCFQIVRVLRNVTELEQSVKNVVMGLLETHWDSFYKKVNEILLEAVEKIDAQAVMDVEAPKTIYPQRNDQLAELVNNCQNKWPEKEMSPKRIIIFGGIPGTIRNAVNVFSFWLGKNPYSKLFFCHDNEVVSKKRMKEINPNSGKDKAAEIREMKDQIKEKMGNEIRRRIYFVEMPKETSIYISIVGNITYFTPLLQGRSSATFTFGLEPSQLVRQLISFMKSRIISDADGVGNEEGKTALLKELSTIETENLTFQPQKQKQ